MPKKTPEDWRPSRFAVKIWLTDRQLDRVIKNTRLELPCRKVELAQKLNSAATNFLFRRNLQEFPPPSDSRDTLKRIKAAARRLHDTLGSPDHEKEMPPAIIGLLEQARTTLENENRKQMLEAGKLDDAENPKYPFSVMMAALSVHEIMEWAEKAYDEILDVVGSPTNLRADQALDELFQDLEVIYENAYKRRPASSVGAPQRDNQSSAGGPFIRFCRTVLSEIAVFLRADGNRHAATYLRQLSSDAVRDRWRTATDRRTASEEGGLKRP